MLIQRKLPSQSSENGPVSKPLTETSSAFGLPQDIRALVADDHPMNRKIMRKIFEEKFRWNVTEAPSAEEVGTLPASSENHACC
mgnify:CR=1 FL=1